MTKNLDFDLDLKTIPVTLRRKNKTPISCVLCELTGDDRDDYIQNIQNRMKPNVQGESTLSDIKGIQSGLLVKTFFKTSENGPQPFTAEEIGAFPSKVLSALYEESQSLSGLGDKAEGLAKKD